MSRKFRYKGPFKQLRRLPEFSFEKFVEQILGPFEKVHRSATLSKALKKVESLSNESSIKFGLSDL